MVRMFASSTNEAAGRSETGTQSLPPTAFSTYEHGEDKRRIHAAGNHFIFARSQ
jgi:hypothetical protein